MAIVTLDTNLLNDSSGQMDVSTDTIISIYIVHETGSHHNHRVALDVSPDGGTTWITEASVLGVGCKTFTVAASSVRVKTVEVEGSASEVKVHMLAR